MRGKEIAVNLGLILIGSLVGSAMTSIANASSYGAKIEAQEKTITALTALVSSKADLSALDKLATSADVRRLGDMIAAQSQLQDRRDAEQDRRIDTHDKQLAEQGRTLVRVDRNLEIVIAILDPDGRISRTIKRE